MTRQTRRRQRRHPVRLAPAPLHNTSPLSRPERYASLSPLRTIRHGRKRTASETACRTDDACNRQGRSGCRNRSAADSPGETADQWRRLGTEIGPAEDCPCYSCGMSSPRAFLQQIARQAMRDRGFEPDFSRAAVAQVAGLGSAAPRRPTGAATCATFPGARSTTTTRATSISSRSPSRGRRRGEGPRRDCRRRRAGETRLPRRPARRAQHDVRLHGRADLSDAARAALDRPHLAQRERGSRRHRRRVRRGARRIDRRVRRLPRRSCAITPSWPIPASARGSKARDRCRRRSRGCRDSRRTCGSRMPRRRR